MFGKKLLALSLVASSALAISTPAMATWGSSSHKHYCDCGHSTGSSMCGTTTSGGSTTSGGTTTSGGGSTSGGTTTSGGGGGSSSGGTDVPEPGMLGIMGMGLLGLAYARRRKARA